MKPVEAEEHLRIIRSLMERATIYRAISAPSALVGGLLSIAACAFEIWIAPQNESLNPVVFSSHFLATWLIVLALTLIANTFFMWQSAKKRRERFFSSGMKMALFCSMPAFLSAFVFTIFVCVAFGMNAHNLSIFLPFVWILFYGLALLSTAHFAPRSIVVLGGCFLITSFLIPFFDLESAHLLIPFPREFCWYNGGVLMALTFGLFHLIYAVCVWPRKALQPDETAR